MNVVKYIFSACLALGWAACTTVDLPDDVLETPVFQLDAVINGETYAWTAGQNDAYMFTSFDATLPDQPISIGKIAPRFCPECPGTFAIEFHAVPPDSSGNPVEHFSAMDYPYDPDSVVVTTQALQLTVNQTGTYTDFVWTLDGVDTYSGQQITQPLASTAPVKVELKATAANGVRSYVSRTIAPASSGTFYPAADMTITKEAQLFHFQAAPLYGTFPETVLWSSGNTTPGFSTDYINEQYSFTLTNSFGNQTVASLQQLNDQDSFFQTSNFSHNLIITDSFSKGYFINLRWTDAEGKAWQSRPGPQPGDAFFRVLASEPFEPNERGEKTQKMQVAFLCTLFNEAGESLKCNGTGVIAVAYP